MALDSRTSGQNDWNKHYLVHDVVFACDVSLCLKWNERLTYTLQFIRCMCIESNNKNKKPSKINKHKHIRICKQTCFDCSSIYLFHCNQICSILKFTVHFYPFLFDRFVQNHRQPSSFQYIRSHFGSYHFLRF